MENTVTISKSEYEKLLNSAKSSKDFEDKTKMLEKENIELKSQVDYLTTLLKLKAIDKYGQKSETYEQLSLFDDVELNEEIRKLEKKIEEESTEKVASYIRKKKRNLVNEDINLPVSIVHVTMDDPDLIDINQDKITKELVYEPA